AAQSGFIFGSECQSFPQGAFSADTVLDDLEDFKGAKAFVLRIVELELQFHEFFCKPTRGLAGPGLLDAKASHQFFQVSLILLDLIAHSGSESCQPPVSLALFKP